jgi:NAD(P)-dependent dehydrogenase (short-subunit alcohol dehydrogenase family)
MSRWTVDDIPDQSGKRAIVTGANSGIGFHTARHLAKAGAEVILACRDVAKAEAARQRILEEVPAAKLNTAWLDLANLESIRYFSDAVLKQERPLDLLINNAGVMALPRRRTTDDGFELQFGTNHLGHFALTSLLLPPILAAPAGRVVTVSSIAHRGGKIRFHDLQWRFGYSPWPAYRQSKLANLLFGYELERRLRQGLYHASSILVHPGVAKTNLFAAGPGASSALVRKLSEIVLALVAQSDEQGALPLLYAATSPDAKGGHFYGPDGFRQMKGWPVEVRAEAQAYSTTLAERLWNVSEELTRVGYSFLSS